MLRALSLAATLTLASAVLLPAGPPHLRVTDAPAGSTPTSLTVHVEHHVEPENFALVARAESRRAVQDGTQGVTQRVVRTMPVQRVNGATFRVPVALERGMPWVIVLGAMQGNEGAHGVAEAIVTLAADGRVHHIAYPKPAFSGGKPARVGDREIQDALATLSTGSDARNDASVASRITQVSRSLSVMSGNALVDTSASVVRWRGTKFGGRGAHAGTVRLRGGALDYDTRKAELRGGVFELDMRSIAVTDMPLGESEARRKLTTHLLAADFFDVQSYPTARFTARRVTTRGGNLARLEGQLTLRGVTRPFAFDATVWSFEPTRLHATARATLDRMQWGVAFRGSRLTNDLVDDTIHLEFDILARVGSTRASL